MDLNNYFMIDIETHYGIKWDDLNDSMKAAFKDHLYDGDSEVPIEDQYYRVAGLNAEFGRVICVCLGYPDMSSGELNTTVIMDKDEKVVLNNLSKTLFSIQKLGKNLAGHNILGFDLPFLCKRYVINRLPVPDFINTYGVKPWEQSHLDTIHLWKMGSWNNVSLQVICASLGIPCKTDDIGGRNLYEFDLDNMPWDKLGHYCREDVVSNYEMLRIINQYYNTD